VNTSSLPKVPPPKRLDGKDRRAVATWIQNMRSTLALSPEKDGTKQVAYAALFLEDAALAWFNTKASIADPSLKSSAGFASFDQFAAALLAEVGEPFPADAARDRLMTLTQSATGSVLSYSTQFQDIIQHLPSMDHRDKRYFYVRGLSDHIKIQLAGKWDENSTRWEELQPLAIKLDTLSSAGSSNSNNGSHGNGSNNTHSPATFTDMDVDALVAAFRSIRHRPPTPGRALRDQPARPGVAHISDEELTRRHGQGLCWRCGKPEHIARHCPTRPRTPSPGRDRA
jgi:hypothetical protein